MKEKILAALREDSSSFTSGKLLSEQLQCSRMAIWKHIEELREQGYRIESRHRRGYRLVSEIEPIDLQQWKSQLSSNHIGKELYYYPVTESTQIIAHQLAREGADEGTCVIADRQTGGRGRLGRKWHAPAGVGLWASFILRPRLPLESVSQMTLVIAAAVAKTLATFGYDPEIKWPNDILIKGKKVCGILTELQGDIDRVKYMIIGIGINVDQRLEEFDLDIQSKATSLYIVDSENRPDRSTLFIELCKQLENLYHIYIEHGFSPIRTIWETYAMAADQLIKVTTHQATYVGKINGITENGILIVKDELGKLHEIISADIEIYTEQQ